MKLLKNPPPHSATESAEGARLFARNRCGETGNPLNG
jgi:hypothetical protein